MRFYSSRSFVEPLRYKSSAMQIFLAYARERWFWYLLGGTSLILTNFTEVFFPKCVQWMVDLLSGAPLPTILNRNDTTESFSTLIQLLLVTWVVQGLSRRYWRLFFSRETHLGDGAMRSSLWQVIRYLPLSRVQTDLTPGVLMNVAAGDTRIARALFGWTLVGTIDGAVLTAFTIGAMALINLRLTLLALVLFPAIFVILHSLQKREAQAHREAQEQLSQFNDIAGQAVASVKLQKVTQSEHLWEKRLRESAEIYRTGRFKVLAIGLLFFVVMGLSPLFSYGVVIYAGLKEVESGALTAGGLIALLSYVLLLQAPLSNLGTVIGDWQRQLASLERIREILALPPAPECVEEPSQVIKGKANTPIIEVKNLTFARGDRIILNNVSFVLRSGERLGLTGEIGSGKSTLFSLLTGLEREYQGEILIEGVPLARYAPSALKKSIGIVPQKPFLFAASIRENILLDLSLTDSEIFRLLEVAGIADEIRALPQGLSTLLGEWGINLSGGQKQRLTLARTLARKPKVLLLDDCFSAVDAETERKIVQRLHDELKGLTVVWSAHRSSTLRYCTKVMELS